MLFIGITWEKRFKCVSLTLRSYSHRSSASVTRLVFGNVFLHMLKLLEKFWAVFPLTSQTYLLRVESWECKRQKHISFFSHYGRLQRKFSFSCNVSQQLASLPFLRDCWKWYLNAVVESTSAAKHKSVWTLNKPETNVVGRSNIEIKAVTLQTPTAGTSES